jgi:hypothetical protein
VLARTLETAGFSTILVTTMPFWAEKIGVPRTLAVEFPYGQTLGQPHDQEQQMRVINQALTVLEGATEPGQIVHTPESWPVPQKEASKTWQPSKPSPIIKERGPHIRAMLRQKRKTNS